MDCSRTLCSLNTYYMVPAAQCLGVSISTSALSDDMLWKALMLCYKKTGLHNTGTAVRHQRRRPPSIPTETTTRPHLLRRRKVKHFPCVLHSGLQESAAYVVPVMSHRNRDSSAVPGRPSQESIYI